jgi:hypothetical protein
MIRVYLPGSLADLARYVAAGEVPPEVERFVAAEEDEESEYAALRAAADAAADAAPGPARRRVVLGAEVADPDAAVPLDRLVAVHADSTPDADPEDDLGWFAVQEIPDLLRDPDV